MRYILIVCKNLIKNLMFIKWLTFSFHDIIYPVPGTPTNLMISPPSGSCDQLMVSWTAPSNTGGLPVKYKVYRDSTLRHSMRTTTTTTWSGLTANTQYTVRVVAFNNLGDGGEVTGTGRTRPQGCYQMSVYEK